MATQVGDQGAIRRDGGPGTEWGSADTYDPGGAGSIVTPLAQAGSDLVSALAARPSLVAGIVAVALAALVGNWLATRFPRRPPVVIPDLPGAAGASRTLGRAGGRLAGAASDTAELVGDAAGSRWAPWGGRRGSAEAFADRLSDRSRSVDDLRGQLQAGMSLLPLGIRLLSNPFVRYYLRRALARQLAQTFRR